MTEFEISSIALQRKTLWANIILIIIAIISIEVWQCPCLLSGSSVNGGGIRQAAGSRPTAGVGAAEAPRRAGAAAVDSPAPPPIVAIPSGRHGGGGRGELWAVFAVIQTGGKQYRVAQGDILAVERLAGEVGERIAFERVLMVAEGGDLGPAAGARVTADILEHKRDAKIIVFKKKRRKKYRRRAGHRQHRTVVKIAEILAAGGAAQDGEG